MGQNGNGVGKKKRKGCFASVQLFRIDWQMTTTRNIVHPLAPFMALNQWVRCLTYRRRRCDSLQANPV